MNKPLLVILLTVLLDGIGVGLIVPILPNLVREMTGRDVAAHHLGLLLALYAVMQFFFSPILGALSDQFGRRPVLLVSLAGAAVDYLLMFFAPTIALLYVGRIVAGITGANLAVVTAYIADVIPEDRRAKAYGYMNACFGLGFVIGPALGGLAGDYAIRSPFLIAAALNATNLVLALSFLPESHKAPSKAFAAETLNPFLFLRYIRTFRGLLTLLAIFFMLHFIGQVPVSLWVLYLEDKFAWTARMVGISFAAFGLLHAGLQAFLTGPATRRLGEVRVLLLGMVSDALGFLMLAMATDGWMVFPILLFLCTGGIAMPALQTLLSKQVGEDHQGELQGILVSLMSVAAIVGPLVFTNLYAATSHFWLGTVWVAGASLYLVGFPVLWMLSRQLRATAVSPESLSDAPAGVEVP
jgi:DHA1 family tetracycline resistance protein-like MFS transporter